MNTKSLLIGGVIGLVLGLIISPMISGDGGIMRNRMMTDNQMMENIDQHFIEQMIPHHEGAIAMAEIALEKGKHAEIKSLAQGIIEAQQQEITDMKNWYESWFDSRAPVTSKNMMGSQNGMNMNSMSGDFDELKNAKDFDQEFIRQMIPHHEMAVMMARMLQTSTDRPEMKQLADNIITSQTKEIEMMRAWTEAWSK